jgi:hypothetical protein
MKKLAAILFAFLLGSGAAHATASTVAAVLTANGSSVNWRGFIGADASGSIGWSFSVGASNVELDALGFYDATLAGLSNAHAVGIWTNGGVLLAQATVPAGTTGTLVGHYRYTTIAPITLTAGQTYVIGAYMPPVVDRCDAACGDVLLYNGTETYDSRITFLQSRQTAGMAGAGTLTFTNLDVGLAQGLFGPNMLFAAPVVVPPPPTPTPVPTPTPTPAPVDPIPALSGVPPVLGIGTQPTVLDLGASQGPTMINCLLATVRSMLGADAQYLGESANGVAKFSQGGRTVSFYALQASTYAGQTVGIHLTGSNVVNIGTSCGNFNVAPAIANLAEFGAAINSMGLLANINAQGLITLMAGNTAYVFRPDYVVASGASGARGIALGSDGVYRFTDSAGNVQVLHPAFLDTIDLPSQVQMALGTGGWTYIQMDGTAWFGALSGQTYVLTPDLQLTVAPPANAAQLWWQDAPNHYLLRSSLLTLAQGFTLQQR